MRLHLLKCTAQKHRLDISLIHSINPIPLKRIDKAERQLLTAANPLQSRANVMQSKNMNDIKGIFWQIRLLLILHSYRKLHVSPHPGELSEDDPQKELYGREGPSPREYDSPLHMAEDHHFAKTSAYGVNSSLYCSHGKWLPQIGAPFSTSFQLARRRVAGEVKARSRNSISHWAIGQKILGKCSAKETFRSFFFPLGDFSATLPSANVATESQ